jgi:uncharacterized protein (DUF1800 family)
MDRVRVELAAWFGLFGLAGCGGVAGSGPAAPQITVSVSGASDVRLGSTAQLAATVANSSNQAVTWKVNGVTGGAAATGMISAGGLYTPPVSLPNPDTVTISAVSAASASGVGTLSEAVWNPVPVVTSAAASEAAPGTTYALNVVGSGFAAGAAIQVNGASVATTYVSATNVQASITLAAGTTSVAVDVVNPDPGSIVSASALAGVQSVVVSIPTAARVLDQATFGPVLSDIALVQQIGVDAYLSQQMNMAATTLPSIPVAGNAICAATNLTPCEQSEWWQTAVTAPDQLRQRVAFALSEMFVISTNSINAEAAVAFQNALAKDAFANFYTVMTDVTLSTGMGGYLNVLDSNKPGNGQIANENFARENMQLFTIGLVELNQDGSVVLDGSGNPIPAYAEAQVQAFARAYTGWTYATAAGGVPAKFPNYTANYDAPMVAVESAHDMATKTLLNGTTLPAGNTAEQDLAGALTNIFNHPNVGPFVSKQLIQHLVESNPTPAYVARVAAVFANNGSGVRGDMKAVVKAILEDSEARAGDVAENTEGGHLREGILYVANVVRGLGFVNSSAVGDWSGLGNYSSLLNERPYVAGSVFNFFPPSYVIPGSVLVAPEFGQENTATGVLRLTLADDIVYNRISGFTVNLAATSPMGLLAANPANLVNALSTMFMHGQMPANMQTAVIQAITPLTDNGQRVRVATYLVLTSSQYKILH